MFSRDTAKPARGKKKKREKKEKRKKSRRETTRLEIYHVPRGEIIQQIILHVAFIEHRVVWLEVDVLYRLVLTQATCT